MHEARVGRKFSARLLAPERSDGGQAENYSVSRKSYDEKEILVTNIFLYFVPFIIDLIKNLF